MSNARLATNVRFLIVEQVATYALPLAVLPYLFRVIGPEKFGLIAFTQAFVAYAVILTDYGFNWSATHKIAKCAKDGDAVARIASAVFVIKASLMVLAGFITASLAWLVPSLRIDGWLLAGCFLAAVGSVAFPIWLLQGLQRMREMVVCSLLGRAVTVGLIFILVRSPEDFRIAAALLSANGIAAGIFALISVPELPNPLKKRPSSSDLSDTLMEGWHLFISNASITLYSNSNIFLLGLLTNPLTVGLFAAAEKIVRAATALLAPIGQAAFPHIAAVAAESQVKAMALIRQMLALQSAVACSIAVFLVLLAGPLVRLLSGPQFADAEPLVRLMAAFPIFVGLSNVFGVQTMLNFGMSKPFSRILLFAGVLNLVLLFALVPTLAARGAALSVVISEGVVALMMTVCLFRTGLLGSILNKG